MNRPSLHRPTVALLLVAALACVARPCQGQAHDCRDGTCGPNCPVRPSQFGYYQTQWRKWPTVGQPTDPSRGAGTPAPPQRVIVPGADEESPRTLPALDAGKGGGTGQDRGVDREPDDEPEAAADSANLPADASRRLALLTTEADAARLGDPRHREEFTRRLVSAMLTESDPRARCVVLGLAAAFDTAAADAICAGALDDPDPRVRLTACQVCGDRRGPESVSRLARRASEDADLGVRLRAVRVLGTLGDPAAVPHLVSLLDDPDPAIQTRATAALARATGRDFGSDVDRWRAWAAAPESTTKPRWSLGSSLKSLF